MTNARLHIAHTVDCDESALINTLLQRGVFEAARLETVSTVSAVRKTVETVLPSAAAPNTPLKQGVNESSTNDDPNKREMSGPMDQSGLLLTP